MATFSLQNIDTAEEKVADLMQTGLYSVEALRTDNKIES